MAWWVVRRFEGRWHRRKPSRFCGSANLARRTRSAHAELEYYGTALFSHVYLCDCTEVQGVGAYTDACVLITRDFWTYRNKLGVIFRSDPCAVCFGLRFLQAKLAARSVRRSLLYAIWLYWRKDLQCRASSLWSCSAIRCFVCICLYVSRYEVQVT